MRAAGLAARKTAHTTPWSRHRSMPNGSSRVGFTAQGQGGNRLQRHEDRGTPERRATPGRANCSGIDALPLLVREAFVAASPSTEGLRMRTPTEEAAADLHRNARQVPVHDIKIGPRTRKDLG